jgi:hypothetical protein
MQIITGDSLPWLQSQTDKSLPHVVTGFPEMAELKITDITEYTEWIHNLLSLIFQKVADTSYVIFIVTDRKYKGQWFSKPFQTMKTAETCNMTLRWHKICLLRHLGKCHIQRPTYSHMLCFSRKAGPCGPGSVRPDVIDVSSKSYPNATPSGAINFVLDFLNTNTKVKSIVDPFCGTALLGKMAVAQGYSYIGIDLNPKIVF